MRKPVGKIRNSRAKMKNGATPSQVRSWDDCPGPFTSGAGVGTGGTSSSGCADPISDEAVIGHPWSNQAKAGAAQGDARKRSGGSDTQHAGAIKKYPDGARRPPCTAPCRHPDSNITLTSTSCFASLNQRDTQPYFTFAPTTSSQCFVIVSLYASCCDNV